MVPFKHLPRASCALVLALLALLCSACGGGGGSAPALTDRLIVTRDEGVAVLDLASGEERVIVPDAEDVLLLDPALSPDAARVAFVRQLTPFVGTGDVVDFGADLSVIDANGGNERVVFQHRERNEQVGWPAWLPGADALLVTLRDITGKNDIYRLDLGSGELALVVADAFQPALSPDGSRMVFGRFTETFAQTLWIADADGGDARQLLGPDQGFISFSWARFSPDGGRLAFGGAAAETATSRGPKLLAAAGAALNGLPQDVWLLDLESGTPERLADLDLDAPSLAWSGDGARLFVIDASGLYLVDVEGGETHRLGDGTFHGQLAWLGAG